MAVSLTESNPIISCHDLNHFIKENENLNRDVSCPSFLILDCTWYDSPTVPSGYSATVDTNQKWGMPYANLFNLDECADVANTWCPHMLPSLNVLQVYLQKIYDLEHPIALSMPIFLYDTMGVFSAPRVWWMFKSFGFTAVCIVNGGFPQWLVDGYPIHPLDKKYKNKFALPACETPVLDTTCNFHDILIWLFIQNYKKACMASVKESIVEKPVATTTLTNSKMIIETDQSEQDSVENAKSFMEASQNSNATPSRLASETYRQSLLADADFFNILTQSNCKLSSLSDSEIKSSFFFNSKLIDARPQQRFLGLVPEPNQAVGSGNIPGSINIPFLEVLHTIPIPTTIQSYLPTFLKNYTIFKQPEELQTQVFASQQIRPTSKENYILSCGSGITANITLLAMHSIGIPLSRFKLYDGSWTEFFFRNGLKIAKTLPK